jgi:hypothetical protein
LEAQQRMRSETITEQLSVANKVHDTEKWRAHVERMEENRLHRRGLW